MPGTSKFIYKTEVESGTQKTNLWLPGDWCRAGWRVAGGEKDKLGDWDGKYPLPNIK